MRTLEEFVVESARHFGGINVCFEVGMFSLTRDLEAVVGALRGAGVPFEIIGGVAVNAHIFSSHPSRMFVTRDIDLLIRREDIQTAAKATSPLGYQGKRMVGGYTLIKEGQDLAEAVHMIFVGERSKSTQPSPHPDLNPESKAFYGLQVPVAPLRDLLRMKLNSFRLKDIVHLGILDDAGLLTPEVEEGLTDDLRARLAEARERNAADKPDIEG